jgi:hypothetical protein
MTRYFLVLVAIMFLSIQAAAVASTPSHAASASCKAQLAASGPTNFAAIYKTTGACVSRMAKVTATQRQALLRAEKTCRAAQVANAGAFAARYGTTKSGKTGSQANAFGKCVSSLASA